MSAVRLDRDAIESAINGRAWPVASARKSGRDGRWPYVPIVVETVRESKTTRQIMNRAFATREEAVACAQVWIDRLKANEATKLADPRCRALREAYGLPREIEHAGDEK